MLRFAPLSRVGAVSYGIYLYHLVVLHFVRALGGAAFETGSALRFAACALGSVAVAELSYRIVESRFLRLRTKFRAPAT